MDHWTCWGKVGLSLGRSHWSVIYLGVNRSLNRRYCPCVRVLSPNPTESPVGSWNESVSVDGGITTQIPARVFFMIIIVHNSNASPLSSCRLYLHQSRRFHSVNPVHWYNTFCWRIHWLPSGQHFKNFSLAKLVPYTLPWRQYTFHYWRTRSASSRTTLQRLLSEESIPTSTMGESLTSPQQD